MAELREEHAQRGRIGFWRGGVYVPRQEGEEMKKFQGRKKERELGIYSHVHRREREIFGVSSTEAMRRARMLEVKGLERVVSHQQRCCSPQGPVLARSPSFWTSLL